MLELFLTLAMGHYLADFGLQSDWMSKFKVPGSFTYWVHVMSAHCAIQALSVFLITHSINLAAIEFVGHFAIDTAKSKGLINFNTDQYLHLGMKILFVALITMKVGI